MQSLGLVFQRGERRHIAHQGYDLLGLRQGLLDLRLDLRHDRLALVDAADGVVLGRHDAVRGALDVVGDDHLLPQPAGLIESPQFSEVGLRLSEAPLRVRDRLAIELREWHPASSSRLISKESMSFTKLFNFQLFIYSILYISFGISIYLLYVSIRMFTSTLYIRLVPFSERSYSIDLRAALLVQGHQLLVHGTALGLPEGREGARDAANDRVGIFEGVASIAGRKTSSDICCKSLKAIFCLEITTYFTTYFTSLWPHAMRRRCRPLPPIEAARFGSTCR